MNHQNTPLSDIFAKHLVNLDDDITHTLNHSDLPTVLHDACLYAMQGGGKRVRPLLNLAAFLTAGGDMTKASYADIKKASLALEFLHGYSLVHDDLPCMDNDVLRRGRATCHIAFGESVALLVGDVLQSLAFEVLARANNPKLFSIFSKAARRMVSGQMGDILGEKQMLNQGALQKVHEDKTGALISAAVLMGAVSAGAKNLHDYSAYAAHLGLAFQVQDDVLDVTASTTALGKTAGADSARQKSTYVTLLGLDGAKNYADALFNKSIAHAYNINHNDNALIYLAKWLQNRQK